MIRIVTFILFYAIISGITAQDKDLQNHVETDKPIEFPVASNDMGSIDNKVHFNNIVGFSQYDLQCYRTLQNRLYVFPDNTIGAVWNIATEPQNWDDRGTGYNYHNGTSWGEFPTTRIEDVKTGFPVYAPYGSDGEIFAVQHFPSSNEGVIILYKREHKGTGDWEEIVIESPQSGIVLYGPAMLTNGEDNLNIHLLACSWPEYQGMLGTLLYSRSSDGGLTWDIQHKFFDELNNEYFSSLGPESYTWAESRGDTIAFSVGFETENGYIMKSFDNGDSWERIAVYQNPFSPYTGGATPAFGAADHTHSLALDSEGNSHLVFGRMIYRYDFEGDAWWYPATEGIVYWNESMEPLDTTILSSFTVEHLIEGGNLIGWTIPFLGDSSIVGIAHYNYNGMTTYPQINIDDEDNIYVIWSSIARGFSNGLYNYRHICGTGSSDGGATWSEIIDFNLDEYYLYKECVFPSMSPTFNMDMVDFLFQCDTDPGMFVFPLEPNFQPNPTENEFILMQVPKDNLLVGVDETNLDKIVKVNMLYPNPAREKITISLAGQLIDHICIYNLAGKKMLQIRPDSYTVNISTLPPGLYIVEVSIGDTCQRQKLLVL